MITKHTVYGADNHWKITSRRGCQIVTRVIAPPDGLCIASLEDACTAACPDLTFTIIKPGQCAQASS